MVVRKVEPTLHTLPKQDKGENDAPRERASETPIPEGQTGTKLDVVG